MTADEATRTMTQQAEDGQGQRSIPSPREAETLEGLRRQLQQERVERGRLEKANGQIASLKEQLKARDEELGDIRRQFDELRGRNEATALRDSLPENVRDGVDSDILDAGAEMARRAAEKVRADMEGQFAAMRSELDDFRGRAEEARSRPLRDQVVRSLDEARPGFIDNVAEGGPWASEWAAFLAKTDPDTGRPYRERLERAYAAGRTGTVDSIVADFLEDTGLGREPPPPLPASAGVEPSPGAGRAGAGPRRYTKAEFEAALRDASNRYYGGSLSRADYDKARAELERALDEGRVSG